MNSIVEIRTYQLKRGTGAIFDRLVHERCLPMLREGGMEVIAARPSLHSPDGYVLMRAYRNLAHREQSQDEFYGSEAWKSGPRTQVLDCIESYVSVVVERDCIAGTSHTEAQQ